MHRKCIFSAAFYYSYTFVYLCPPQSLKNKILYLCEFNMLCSPLIHYIWSAFNILVFYSSLQTYELAFHSIFIKQCFTLKLITPINHFKQSYKSLIDNIYYEGPWRLPVRDAQPGFF